jgi:hypothetical protein
LVGRWQAALAICRGDKYALAAGDLLNTLTPVLAVTSGICFLLAAAALLRWIVPGRWFQWLIVAGAILSIALLWAVFGARLTVDGIRHLTSGG